MLHVGGLELVHAVLTAERFRHSGRVVQASPVLRIEFYNGTSLLDSISSHSKLIWIGGKEYLDKSGAIEEVEQRYFAELVGRGMPNSP
jgi:hypothetical protein